MNEEGKRPSELLSFKKEYRGNNLVDVIDYYDKYGRDIGREFGKYSWYVKKYDKNGNIIYHEKHNGEILERKYNDDGVIIFERVKEETEKGNLEKIYKLDKDHKSRASQESIIDYNNNNIVSSIKNKYNKNNYLTHKREELTNKVIDEKYTFNNNILLVKKTTKYHKGKNSKYKFGKIVFIQKFKNEDNGVMEYWEKQYYNKKDELLLKVNSLGEFTRNTNGKQTKGESKQFKGDSYNYTNIISRWFKSRGGGQYNEDLREKSDIKSINTTREQHESIEKIEKEEKKHTGYNSIRHYSRSEEGLYSPGLTYFNTDWKDLSKKNSGWFNLSKNNSIKKISSFFRLIKNNSDKEIN